MVMNMRFTPRQIVRQLDVDIIGQDEAKKTLAVAVYAHFRKLEQARRSAVELAKSNVLLIGPSGTGKTLMCESLSRILGVPFVTANATSLAQTRYVNEEIEAILQRLLDKAGGQPDLAQFGIVFIDEIDKLRFSASQSGASSGESVQHALLKIMEGTLVRLAGETYLDTTNILFICGGAFVGLDDILHENQGYGFIGATGYESQSILDRLNSRVKPADLAQFGLIPEFTGRLPVVARFHALTRDLLVRILVEPRGSIYHQFRDLLQADGVELVLASRVFDQIAELAVEYQSGARSLRGIFEELMTPVLYRLPDEKNIQRVMIDSLLVPARLE